MISKTPYFLTNKIISTISTILTFRPFRLSKIISTIQNHFDYPKSFRLSKIVSTFNFDHGPKVEIFRLLDFNFDFKYSTEFMILCKLLTEFENDSHLVSHIFNITSEGSSFIS